MELLARIEGFARSSDGRVAYVDLDGTHVTYAALARGVTAVRKSLLHVDAGATILLHSGNRAAFAMYFLGALSAGLHVLPLAESTTEAEVNTFAERLGASGVISATLATCRVPLLTIELAGHGADRPKRVPFGDLLLASSGSTGVPKIVRRSAASLDAVAANMVEAIGFCATDRVLAAVPLAHSYGLEHGLLAPLWAGARVHLFEGLSLDGIAAVEEPFTIFPAVPSMLERLADIGTAVAGVSRIQTIYSAGAPLPDAVRERFTARYGRQIGQLYGSSELGTVTYRAGHARVGNDVGWPMRDVCIRILASGEVAIRSPSMFTAYVDADVDLAESYFLTGDLGHLSADGALVLSGRNKLLIDVGGLKVDPMEVEAALGAHPQVRECVVVPLRQSETVSRLRAIVVARDARHPPTVEALRTHARSCLASHKVPRVFEFRSALPRSATGKLLRTMLDDS